MAGKKHFKFMDQTETARRRQALAEGTRGKWFRCLLCGWNQRMESINKGPARFDRVDLRNDYILQDRAGGGAIRGWYTDPDASLTLSELVKDPQYKDLLQQIRKRCLEITAAIK